MSENHEREKVFIARVPTGYDDHAAIVAAVERGLDALGYVPPAKLAGKANWVCAHDQVAAACYTRPEFLRAALEAIFARNSRSEITLVGNSGAGVPTRQMARRARGKAPEFAKRGAYELERMFPGRVTIDPSDSGKVHRYRLSVGPELTHAERHATDAGPIDGRKRYWREIETSAALRGAEDLILFPKLKSNVLSHGVTGAMKLTGIGLLLDHDRMDGHNFHNHRRIADMMEIAEPDLIVTDAIEIALGGNQMTERGYPLRLVIMARNAVAHDATLARILGLHPEKVEHIRLAHERGYGPIWANEIELLGDMRIGEANANVRSYGETGFIPVVDFPKKYKREAFVDFPLEILARPPWDVAGSHGLVLDWLYMTYDFRPLRRSMAEWPPATIMVGAFPDGIPSLPKHDRVYVVGDRAIEAWRRLGWHARRFVVPRWLHALVRGPRALEWYHRPDGRRGLAFLIAGDPPTHRDMILSLAIGTKGKVRPPLLRFDLILDSYVRMWATRFRRWWNNRGGIEVVDASSIERLKARKAARAGRLAAIDAAAAVRASTAQGA